MVENTRKSKGSYESFSIFIIISLIENAHNLDNCVRGCDLIQQELPESGGQTQLPKLSRGSHHYYTGHLGPAKELACAYPSRKTNVVLNFS